MDPRGRAAVQLLIDEAWSLHRDDRYPDALRAAEQALRAAEELGDEAMVVKTSVVEAVMCGMLGDHARALARYTRVIATSRDPVRSSALAAAGVDWYVAKAWFNWVDSARFLPEVSATDLLGVLEEAEAWLAATGHRPWRSATCHLRARVLDHMGRTKEALAHAEEGLSLQLAHPVSPGYTLATHRCTVGHLLWRLGRHDEAGPHYRNVLDDPGSDDHGRKVAEQGLSRCATGAGDHDTAARHARRAVELAEAMGDDALTGALDALTDALIAAGDVTAASAVATRRLDAARRVGGEYGLYFALRGSFDVALRQGELQTAADLLAEARPLAAAIDRSRANHAKADEIAKREGRLAEARDSVGPGSDADGDE